MARPKKEIKEKKMKKVKKAIPEIEPEVETPVATPIMDEAKEERKKFLTDLQLTMEKERITCVQDIEFKLAELNRR